MKKRILFLIVSVLIVASSFVVVSSADDLSTVANDSTYAYQSGYFFFNPHYPITSPPLYHTEVFYGSFCDFNGYWYDSIRINPNTLGGNLINHTIEYGLNGQYTTVGYVIDGASYPSWSDVSYSKLSGVLYCPSDFVVYAFNPGQYTFNQLPDFDFLIDGVFAGNVLYGSDEIIRGYPFSEFSSHVDSVLGARAFYYDGTIVYIYGTTNAEILTFGALSGFASNVEQQERLNSYVSTQYPDYMRAYSEGYTDGYTDGSSDGYLQGYDDGESVGLSAGYEAGYEIGYDEGFAEGASSNPDDSYNAGYDAGFTDGYDEGYVVGDSYGYRAGYDVGLDEGYDNGYSDGRNSQVTDTFGDNLLGSTLNVPFDALKEFVLVDSSQGYITFGVIVGGCIAVVFFIAFLKIFAGG